MRALPILLLSAGLGLSVPVQGLGGSAPKALANFPQSTVTVTTTRGDHQFRVWVANTAALRSQGLMHVEALADDRGMLFVFDRPQLGSFWMKNTPLSLDIIFIRVSGEVESIAYATRPFSLEPVESNGLIATVLEVRAGTAARIGLRPGDRITQAAESPK